MPIKVPGIQLSTTSSGIANNGLVVGDYGSTPKTYSFIFNGSTYETLPNIPNGQNTTSAGINNNGEVAGTSKRLEGGILTTTPLESVLNSSYNPHGFLYKNGTYKNIDFPNATQTSVTGINDSGEIVGRTACYGQCGNKANLGFVYDGSTYVTLEPPGNYVNVSAKSINNNGVVLGTADNLLITASPSSLASTCHPNVIYNFWSHGLIMQDVLVDGTHYYAKLTDQGNYNFQLTDSHPVANGTCPASEVIGYSNNTLTIPSVLVYGSIYSLTLLKNKDSGLYSMTSYSINPVTQ